MRNGTGTSTGTKLIDASGSQRHKERPQILGERAVSIDKGRFKSSK